MQITSSIYSPCLCGISTRCRKHTHLLHLPSSSLLKVSPLVPLKPLAFFSAPFLFVHSIIYSSFHPLLFNLMFFFSFPHLIFSVSSSCFPSSTLFTLLFPHLHFLFSSLNLFGSLSLFLLFSLLLAAPALISPLSVRVKEKGERSKLRF